MTYHYKRPVYSEEQYKIWRERARKSKEFAERHSKETVKVYDLEGVIIKCIQRKYDKCMKKENEYGIQVFIDKTENCISNEWFNNLTEANEYFKNMKQYLK